MQDAAEHPKWYAVLTGPKGEWKADQQLRRRGFYTFFPILRVTKREKVRGTRAQFRKVEREYPYFKRYLFVALRFQYESVYQVNETPYVSTVVYLGGEPLPIPHKVMDAIMEQADSAGVMGARDEVSRKRYEVGQAVTFADEHPAVGLLTQIAADDGGEAVQVWLEMLGKKQRVSVDVNMIRPAEALTGT